MSLFGLLGGAISAGASLLGGAAGSSSAGTIGRAYHQGMVEQAKHIRTGHNKAKQYLRDGRKKQLDYYNRAMNAQIESIGRGIEAVEDAKEEGTGYLKDAQGNYIPYMETGEAGLKAWADIHGLNGPEAAAAAMQMYETSPGFQASVDYAMDQVEQSAANRGGMASGGTMAGLTQVAQRMKLDDFYKWRDNLGQTADMGFQATNSYANVGAQLAELAFQSGQSIAGLHKSIGGVQGDSLRAMGDIHDRFNVNKANLRLGRESQLGQLKYNTILGQANASAQGQMAQAQGLQGALGGIAKGVSGLKGGNAGGNFFNFG